MKIDPTDGIAPFSHQAVDKLKENQGSGGFDSILQDSIQKSNPSKGCVGQSIPLMPGVLPPAGIQPDCRSMQYTMAQGLLDRLDCYQKMLADPDATLRMIQPAVAQMEQQAVRTEALLSDLPEGHPLKMILQDAILNINQEIERFNSGYYVDGDESP